MCRRKVTNGIFHFTAWPFLSIGKTALRQCMHNFWHGQFFHCELEFHIEFHGDCRKGDVAPNGMRLAVTCVMWMKIFWQGKNLDWVTSRVIWHCKLKPNEHLVFFVVAETEKYIKENNVCQTMNTIHNLYLKGRMFFIGNNCHTVFHTKQCSSKHDDRLQTWQLSGVQWMGVGHINNGAYCQRERFRQTIHSLRDGNDERISGNVNRGNCAGCCQSCRVFALKIAKLVIVQKIQLWNGIVKDRKDNCNIVTISMSPIKAIASVLYAGLGSWIPGTNRIICANTNMNNVQCHRVQFTYLGMNVVHTWW